MRRWTAGALLSLGCACATAPPLPAERLAQAEAEVRAAQEIGAERAPQAKLHLQEARDTLASARETSKDDPDGAARKLDIARAQAESRERARPGAGRSHRGGAGAHPARHAAERHRGRGDSSGADGGGAMRPGTRVLLLGAALSGGCAHLATTDRLDEARTAYEKAQEGPAAASSPADSATAKKFLDLAEKGLETGDPKLVDDRATVAILKIRSAEALGRTHELAAERDRTLEAVSVTKQQLLDEANQKLMLARTELEKEKAARDTMEARLTQSRSTLAQETQIRDLPEGTVITLPGGQLFQQGRAELLPAGRDQLSRVAEFLKSASRSARVTAQPPIRGSRKAALALSGKRAESVRDYLLGEGVTAQQIITDPPSATPTRQLPDSPEFATHGAVDIVLQPARGGGTTGPGTR